VFNEHVSPAQTVGICFLDKQADLARGCVCIKYRHIGWAYRDGALSTAFKVILSEQCISLLTVLQGETHMIDSILNKVT
jgi:hypothetical protein